MSGTVTLSNFNPGQIRARARHAAKPHKVMGEDGRYYFKGRRLRGRANLESKAKLTVPYQKTGNPVGNPNFGIPGAIERGTHTGFTMKYKLKDLIVAIHKVEEELEEDLLVHFVKQGFKNSAVLKDLMKKLLPDLKHIDADIDVTEQFQLIIDASGKDEDDDIVDAEVVTPKALPAPKRRVKIQRKRKSA